MAKLVLISFSLVLVLVASTSLPSFAEKSPEQTLAEYFATVQTATSVAQLDQYNVEKTPPFKPAEGISLEKAEQMYLEGEKFSNPYSIVVTQKKLEGNKVVLTIKGATKAWTVGGKERPVTGTIGMVKVGDDWKILSSILNIGDPNHVERAVPAASMAGRSDMAVGQIRGENFSVADAQVNSKQLVLKSASFTSGLFQGVAKFSFDLDFKDPIVLEDKSYSGTSLFNGPKAYINMISHSSDSSGKSTTEFLGDNYKLLLRFYKAKGNLVPGYIDLDVPKFGNHIKGFFYARRVPDATHSK